MSETSITKTPINSVNAQELESVISLQLDMLKSHPEQACLIPPLMIWGAPGLGKSTIVRELCKKRKIGFIDVRLAQREPVDIRGLPVPKENGVEWLVSAEWPRDPESSGIILFDELTAADRSLQVAAYEFILDRRLGDLYHVPDGWYIMGAGNRNSDRAVAYTMSSALANRFLHLELEADAESWVSWAQRNDIQPSVTGFIRYRPGLLFSQENQQLERGWPSPRSWERVSMMVKNLPEKKQEPMLRKLIYGLVGFGVGLEFMAFYQTSREMEDVLEIMRHPKREIQIPTKADQRYAITSAMSYFLRQGIKSAEQSQLLEGFFRISMELPSDFAALAMIDAAFGEAETADLLYNHPLFPAWEKKHGAAFRNHLGDRI